MGTDSGGVLSVGMSLLEIAVNLVITFLIGKLVVAVSMAQLPVSADSNSRLISCCLEKVVHTFV